MGFGSLLEEALALQEQVHAADRRNAAFTSALATAHYWLGTLRDVQGRPADATRLFERSRQLRQSLVDISADERNRTRLMLSLARSGEVDAARALTDELGESTVENGELHLERARALAQIARRQPSAAARAETIDAALTALERAVAEGYGDPFRIEAETDLDPLHDEPRFRSVVAKLRAQMAGSSAD